MRQEPSRTILRRAAGRSIGALLALVALSWITGCATSEARGRHSADLSQDGGGFGFWEPRDDFQLLQRSAGLEEDFWHEAGEELETEDARALWDALARTRTTLQSFGPRRALHYLLRQVLARDEGVPYADLAQRIRPFHFLVVMRPDGYLAGALTGEPMQRMGRVELRDGRFMAGNFEVGAFYWDRGGVFYPVDEALRPSGGLVGELGLERDWFNAALDGAEDALGEMGQALAQFVTAPVRSIQGLQQLPSAVAGLIASSPDYFARYSTLPLQEQIREAARLSTHLLMLYGSAAGTATRVGSAGARLPVLSLAADGTLAVEQLVVPVGTTAATLGTGISAIYVLMEPGKAPDEGGQAQVSDSAKGTGGFKPFTESNFRENLGRLTGQLPAGSHAHHVFPRSFAKEFGKAGINVHEPRFGAWWERSRHLKNAAAYTKRWGEILSRNPTFEQILQYGRDLGGEFGFKVNF